MCWASEIERWIGVRSQDIHVLLKGGDAAAAGQANLKFIIVSYDLLPRLEKDLEGRCKILIADESHYIKNHAVRRHVHIAL